MNKRDLMRIATILECEATRLELMEDARVTESVMEYRSLADALRNFVQRFPVVIA